MKRNFYLYVKFHKVEMKRISLCSSIIRKLENNYDWVRSDKLTL